MRHKISTKKLCKRSLLTKTCCFEMIQKVDKYLVGLRKNRKDKEWGIVTNAIEIQNRKEDCYDAPIIF